MKNLTIVFVLAVLFISCKKKEAGNPYPVSSSDQKFGTLYEIVLDQSIIYWIGSSPTGSHNGTLKLKSSNLEINPQGQLIRGRVILDMNSIANLDIEDVNDRNDLISHLKDGDFFATDTFPEADFVINSATPIVDSISNQLIRGDLTLRGITKPIEFKASIIASGNTSLITVPEFTIDRTLWNVNYKSSKILEQLKDELISDQIRISMKIIAVRK
ncbi:MAG: YceI family protein [Saprospiraceae bacterium]|nr:YceI family protein [Saprospiraceae bacterium]